MTAWTNRCSLAVAALAVLGLGCGYSPEFDSGRLRCSVPDKTCPEGYYCGLNDRCWRDGETAQTRFIGNWNFVRPSTRTIQCNDGSMETEDWAGEDFIPIQAGAGQSLQANFFCPWVLDVNSTGSATMIQPNQSCTAVDLDDPTVTYTWRGESFAVTSTDGRTGSGEMRLPYSYVTPAGTGSCTMNYAVTLTKDDP